MKRIESHMAQVCATEVEIGAVTGMKGLASHKSDHKRWRDRETDHDTCCSVCLTAHAWPYEDPAVVNLDMCSS